jgi:hypothetical protein
VFGALIIRLLCTTCAIFQKTLTALRSKVCHILSYFSQRICRAHLTPLKDEKGRGGSKAVEVKSIFFKSLNGNTVSPPTLLSFK